MNRSFISIIAAALWMISIGVGHASTGKPLPTYLALGDSLAYGMQIGHLKEEIASGKVTASSFDTGYVNLITLKLKKENPDLHVINLGCPAETTSSFIDGPCGYATTGAPFGSTPLPLHHTYKGSQLSTAIRILRGHNYNVKLITLDLGINDLRAIELKCSSSPNFQDCLKQGWPMAEIKVDNNLKVILKKIRSAAPHTKILVMTYYNWLALQHPSSNNEVRQLNKIITQSANSVGATTVDVFPSFNDSDNIRSHLCKLSLICGPTKDLHPTNAGYRLIADLFEKNL